MALQRNVELVSATEQGVTIQLLIPESDFHFNSSDIEIGTTISFANCRFTTEPGTPRLPIQTTLIAVPADVDFQLRIVEKRFSTRSVERIAYTPAPQGTTQQEKDRFSPTLSLKLGKPPGCETTVFFRSNSILFSIILSGVK